MSYDRCPDCSGYKIEYTGVNYAGYQFEVICYNCGFHGAYSWEPFVAPYKCTSIGLALRNYIVQYHNAKLDSEFAGYIKGIKS